MHDFDEAVDRRQSDSVKWRRYDPDVIPLYAADMDFASPAPVQRALHERVEHGFFGYPVESAELRELWAERLQRLYGWQVAPEWLVFTPGVAVGVSMACRTVAEPGDGVLIPTPIYAFLSVLDFSRFDCVQVPLNTESNGRYVMNFEALEGAITDRTRALFLCNPHNPVGRAYRPDELERLADICLRRRIAICSDEVFSDLLFPGSRHTPIASLAPEIGQQTFTLMSPGKTFNLAGCRVAVAIIPNPQLRARFQAIGGGIVPEVSIFGYVAALAAYREGQSWLEEVLRYLEGNRDFVAEYVRSHLPGVRMVLPEATYVAWLDCRQAGIPGNPADFFLRQARVAVNDGATFGRGYEQFVRLVFGSPRSLVAEALDRMAEALRRRP